MNGKLGRIIKYIKLLVGSVTLSSGVISLCPRCKEYYSKKYPLIKTSYPAWRCHICRYPNARFYHILIEDLDEIATSPFLCSLLVCNNCYQTIMQDRILARQLDFAIVEGEDRCNLCGREGIVYRIRIPYRDRWRLKELGRVARGEVF